MNKNVRDKRLNIILSNTNLHPFLNTGNTVEMQEALAKPIPPYIYFAGEHTIPEYIGSVHGAYISGERAAKKIRQRTTISTTTATVSTPKRFYETLLAWLYR